MLKVVGFGGALLTTLLASTGAVWAGACTVPAPLVGVTGPYGIVAAGIACGGYLLFRRYRDPR